MLSIEHKNAYFFFQTSQRSKTALKKRERTKRAMRLAKVKMGLELKARKRVKMNPKLRKTPNQLVN